MGHSGRILEKVIPKKTEYGSFNGYAFDLHRNGNCRWDIIAIWRNKKIRGGPEPVSEIEPRILKTFQPQSDIQCVVFSHSQYP